MRLASKITLTILLLLVVALVSYLQTDLREKRISKMVTEKTQERLSSGYNASEIMGADSVYDPNAIPVAENSKIILPLSKTNSQSKNTALPDPDPNHSPGSESIRKKTVSSGAMQESETKTNGEERDGDETDITSTPPNEAPPPTILALTVSEKTPEDESGGFSEFDTALDFPDSSRVNLGRDELILEAMNARLKRLPGDLSDYEKLVAIAEIRDDICEDFSISSATLDSILAKSRAAEKSNSP